MIPVKRMTVSFRCPIDHVEAWDRINSLSSHQVEIKRINDNGEEATMEISGSPEDIVHACHWAGQFKVEMHSILTKFQ